LSPHAHTGGRIVVASYPAIHDPGILEKLLDVIESSEPPRVVDGDFLEGAGLRRETDNQLMHLLEFLGYIDENHQPTNIWLQSRDRSRAPGLLAGAVRAAYWKLFQQYPDAAETTDGSSLMSFFRGETEADERTAAYMILTFKVLCDLSDFDAPEAQTASPAEQQPEPSPREAAPTEPAVEEAAAEAETKPVAEAGPPAAEPAPRPARQEAGGRVILQLELDASSDPELAALVKRLLRERLGE
jgi:hypothetical protein